MDWIAVKQMVLGGLLMLAGTLGVKIIDVTILSYRMGQVESGLIEVKNSVKDIGTKIDKLIIHKGP